MYFRLVRLKVRPESFCAFRDYYESRILPGLESAGGCLYAALLRPVRPAEEAEAACDSLTLWESEERADRSEERRVGKECIARWSPDH